MTIKEAVKIAKDAAEQSSAFAKLAGALSLLENGEEQLQQLANKKAYFDKAISEKSASLAKVESELDIRKNDFDSQEISQSKKISDLMKKETDTFMKLKQEQSAAVARHKQEIKEETARLVGERKAALDKIEKTLSMKTAQLDEANAELERVKTKVFS